MKKEPPVKSGHSHTYTRPILIILSLAFLVVSLSLPTLSYSHERNLRLIAPWELKGIDPVKSGYIFQRMEIIETLTSVDHDGNQTPGLATDWSTSSDGLQWIFNLRQGVRFHDGTALTVEAVVNALRIGLQKPGILKKMPIESIESKADSILISLTEPCPMLDSALAHYSTCILAPSCYDENGEVTKLIATGPYAMVSFEPPQKIIVQAFNGYWGEVAAIKSAQYLAVARNETRALMAQSGDADITFTLDPVTMRRLERFKRIDVASTSLPRTIVIKLNCAIPGLDTPALRRALSNGLDRKGIALTVMRSTQSSAYQLFPAAFGQWHLDSIDEQTNSTPGFKELLMAKGWNQNTNGILEKDGKPLEMTIVTYSDRAELPVAATALQDQMRKMGIKLNVSITNSSAIPQGHSEGTLEMGLLARNYGLISNPLGTILQDYGPNGGDWGAMNWKNEEMQVTLNTLRQSTDAVEQTECIHSICEILNTEMPTIPVVSYQHSAALSKDIVGFSLDSLERSYRISELHWSEEQ